MVKAGWSFIFVTLFILSTLQSIQAQQCLSACNAGLSVCSNIYYDVYVTDMNKTAQAEHNALEFLVNSYFLSIPNRDPLVPLRCYGFLPKFICNIMHPGCDASEASPTLAKPCTSMCLELQESCAGLQNFLPEFVRPYFNCSGKDSKNQTLYSSDVSSCTSVNVTVNPLAPPRCYNYPPKVLQYPGTCQKLNLADIPIIAGVCEAVLSEYVFLPSAWPSAMGYWDSHFGPSVTTLGAVYPITPPNCYNHLAAVYCNMILPACEPVYLPEYNVTVGAPRNVCRTICDDANNACEHFYDETQTGNTYNVNCSTYANAPPKYPFYIPLNSTAFRPLQLSCIGDVFPEHPAVPYFPKVVENCPKETGRNTEFTHNGKAPCTLQCPDSSYTSAEWKSLNQLILAGASLSLICMVFLILTYLLQFERRKFPSNLHVWQFVATSMFAIGFLINGPNPEKNVWCYDEGTYANQSNVTACGVQGFFFIFFGISLTAWCAVIAAIMFYAIVFTKKVSNLRRYSAFYHLFAWGGPLVFGIAALASKSIGYGPPLAWCFIHFQGFGYGTGLSRDYPLFYIPEAVLFIPILIMFLSTVAKIIYVRRLSIAETSVARSGSRTFRAQVRVLIFSFMIFIIIFTIFEWRLQIDVQDGKNIASVGIHWVYCKVKKSLNLPVVEKCDGDESPARVDYAHTAFESFVLSGVGIVVFIGFGADINIYYHWVKMAKLVWTRKWAELHDFVMHGKDPFGSRSISKSNSKNSNSKSSFNEGQHERTSRQKNSQSESISLSQSDSVDVQEESKSKKVELFAL